MAILMVSYSRMMPSRFEKIKKETKVVEQRKPLPVITSGSSNTSRFTYHFKSTAFKVNLYNHKKESSKKRIPRAWSIILDEKNYAKPMKFTTDRIELTPQMVVLTSISRKQWQ